MANERQILLRSQQNTVLQIVLEEGLNPEDFKWDGGFSLQTERLEVSVLIHEPSGFYFYFDFFRGAHHCTFSPGNDKLVESDYPGDWKLLLSYCRRWLQNLKREIEAPDLWAQLRSGAPAVFNLESPADLTLYTDEQKDEIRLGISRFRALIEETFAPTAAELARISARLDYMETSLDRLNRFDWQSVALSTIIAISIALTLDAERGRQLFTLFQSALSGMVNLPTP